MKNRRLTKTDLWAAVLCLMSMLPGAIFYNKIPDDVPMHWDIHNNPTSLAPKWAVLFLFPALLCILNLVVSFFSAGSKQEEKMPKQMRGFVRFIIPTIAILLETVTVGYTMDNGYFSNIGAWVACLLGVMFIVMGNYLPKTQRNWAFGIKIPPTLKSDVVWAKTHRLGGRLFVIAGFAAIILALAGYPIISIIAIAASVLITMIYAFIISE